MAFIEFYWTKTDPIRIDEFARDLGFNLRAIDFSGIPENQRTWIDGKIRNTILAYISECWEDEVEERTTPLSTVSQGIYIITLSDNLSIDYNGKPSPVLYIGRGQIRKRLSCHLENWIRYFSESLQGIEFHIWMTEIKVKGSKNAFKEVECDLLNDFYAKFEDYPIQNSKSGDYHEKEHDYEKGWNKPLWNPSNINDGWSIKPLQNNWWSSDYEENV